MPLQNPIEASGPLPGVFATPSEGPHFRSVHSWLGMLVLALYWLQANANPSPKP